MNAIGVIIMIQILDIDHIELKFQIIFCQLTLIMLL